MIYLIAAPEPKDLWHWVTVKKNKGEGEAFTFTKSYLGTGI